MRVPIYEAVAHYKKNNELPYTEYFCSDPKKLDFYFRVT